MRKFIVFFVAFRKSFEQLKLFIAVISMLVATFGPSVCVFGQQHLMLHNLLARSSSNSSNYDNKQLELDNALHAPGLGPLSVVLLLLSLITLKIAAN